MTDRAGAHAAAAVQRVFATKPSAETVLVDRAGNVLSVKSDSTIYWAKDADPHGVGTRKNPYTEARARANAQALGVEIEEVWLASAVLTRSVAGLAPCVSVPPLTLWFGSGGSNNYGDGSKAHQLRTVELADEVAASHPAGATVRNKDNPYEVYFYPAHARADDFTRAQQWSDYRAAKDRGAAAHATRKRPAPGDAGRAAERRKQAKTQDKEDRR